MREMQLVQNESIKMGFHSWNLTKNLVYIVLPLLFLLTGCETHPIFTDENYFVEEIIPMGNEEYLSIGSDYIFNQDSLFTFEIIIPEAALMQLDADPTAEKYVEAAFRFKGETIAPIGVRYKGSVGAFQGCVTGLTFGKPSGRKKCTKLSMKVKINWTDSENTFYGVKKFQFHAQGHDPSQMHERLGYWLFREMGVPAPRAVHVRLLINGEYSGLYTLVEQIDDRFTNYNFTNGDGNLFKEVGPLRSTGQARSVESFVDHLKEGSASTTNPPLISDFAKDIEQTEIDSVQIIIAKWMDIDKIIAYAVVDRTIRIDDGPFHWYCNDGYCRNHNYYWYEEPGQELIYLIPWDLDMAFKNIRYNKNPNIAIADNWGESRSDCEPFFYGFSKQKSAACDKLIGGWASYVEEYARIKDDLILGPFSEATLGPLLRSWEEQIRNATIEASNTHRDAISINKWENALEDLRKSLVYAREN